MIKINIAILLLSVFCINQMMVQSKECKRMLRVGLAQMKVVDNEVDVNLNNAEKQIAKAKKQGADIVFCQNVSILVGQIKTPWRLRRRIVGGLSRK